MSFVWSFSIHPDSIELINTIPHGWFDPKAASACCKEKAEANSENCRQIIFSGWLIWKQQEFTINGLRFSFINSSNESPKVYFYKAKNTAHASIRYDPSGYLSAKINLLEGNIEKVKQCGSLLVAMRVKDKIGVSKLKNLTF